MLPKLWGVVVVFQIGGRNEAYLIKGTTRAELEKRIDRMKKNLASQNRVPVVVKRKIFKGT